MKITQEYVIDKCSLLPKCLRDLQSLKFGRVLALLQRSTTYKELIVKSQSSRCEFLMIKVANLLFHHEMYVYFRISMEEQL